MKKRFLLSVLCLLSGAVPSLAAIVHVQTVSTDTTSASTISQTVTLTAGNAAIVTLMINENKTNVGTVNQTAGDTTTSRCNIDNSGTYQEQRDVYSVAGGSTTFTFTWTTAATARIFVTEVSGLTTTGFDKTASTAQTTNTTHDSGTTATLTQAAEFALASFHADGSGTTNFTSATNSYIVPTNGNQLGAGKNMRGLIAYLITAATTATNTVITTDNVIADGLIGTYKGASVANSTTSFMMGFIK
jgi:hypothetical protein